MTHISEILKNTQLAAAAKDGRTAVSHLTAAADLARAAGFESDSGEVPDEFTGHPGLLTAFQEGHAAAVAWSRL